MTAPQTVADVLDAAADLLTPEGAWITGKSATTKDGEYVNSNHPEAACFCALGAILRSGGDPINADDFFGAHIKQGGGWWAIGQWNDSFGRTQSEVVAALRAAATSARQGEAK